MANNFVFKDSLPVAPLKIAALESCQDLASKVNDHIVQFRRNDMEELMRRKEDLHYRGYDVDSYLLKCSCPRFGTGEGKMCIRDSACIHISGHIGIFHGCLQGVDCIVRISCELYRNFIVCILVALYKVNSQVVCCICCKWCKQHQALCQAGVKILNLKDSVHTVTAKELCLKAGLVSLL